MNLDRLYAYLYALSLASFYASEAGIFGSVGNNMRWPFVTILAIATLVMLMRHKLHLPWIALAPVYVFFCYLLLTLLWTDNFLLTVTKLLLYTPVVLLFFIGGSLLSTTQLQRPNPYWVMAPLYVLLLASSFLSYLTGGGVGGLFSGLTHNPNSLAAMLVFTSPWIVVALQQTPSGRKKRLLWVAASAGMVFLLLTHSRTSIVMAIALISPVFWISKGTRKAMLAYALLMVVALAYGINPQIFGEINQSLVKKSNDSILSSREGQMVTSLEKAREGGVFGVGYGLSAGMSEYWTFGSFSGDYSREKGSSQLAVIEECGIVGFLFYLLLIGGICLGTVRWGRLASVTPEGRLLFVLLLGFFVGAILHSMFEAWFLSPGMETSSFWAMVGISFGALYRTAVMAPQV